MKIVIDGMGGDNAPSAVVKGVVMASKAYDDIDVYITGPKEQIEEELSKHVYPKERVFVVDAKEVISPNEHSALAIRRKKDSSIVKALELVRDKTCDAVISAGSTGAFLSGCTFIVGRIKGVERPALAPIMPGRKGHFMIVDVGANVDCKPSYLVQFAKMGKVYCKEMLSKENPTVGLVNIGTEEEKGNTLTKEVFKLLKESEPNFIGNVEPREVPTGEVNVLVTDGFVGNTLLKMYEGTAMNLFGIIKDEIMASGIKSKLGAKMLSNVFGNIKKKFDYTEVGGAPFLGVNGICVKAHGSSDDKAFKNAFNQVRLLYQKDVIWKIEQEIKKNID